MKTRQSQNIKYINLFKNMLSAHFHLSVSSADVDIFIQ